MMSVSMLDPLNKQCHISDQFNIHIVKFYKQIVNFDREIVNFIVSIKILMCLSPSLSMCIHVIKQFS